MRLNILILRAQFKAPVGSTGASCIGSTLLRKCRHARSCQRSCCRANVGSSVCPAALVEAVGALLSSAGIGVVLGGEREGGMGWGGMALEACQPKERDGIWLWPLGCIVTVPTPHSPDSGHADNSDLHLAGWYLARGKGRNVSLPCGGSWLCPTCTRSCAGALAYAVPAHVRIAP